MAKKRSGKKVIGITGGIGSGQSTVAGFLQKKGVYIIDADQKGRAVLETFPEINKQLQLTFGNSVYTPSGKLDRKKLGQIVFSSEVALEKLNSIIHPRMIELILDEVEENRHSGQHRFLAVDAALIYELQMDRLFEIILCVDAPLEQRISRIMERNNLSREEILQRVKSQFPLENKVDWSEFVILNNSDLPHIHESVEVFWEKITAK